MAVGLLLLTMGCVQPGDAAPVSLSGAIPEDEDLSAIALGPDGTLFAGSDETTEVTVLKRTGAAWRWTVSGSVSLPVARADEEVDIEAIAVSGTWVYVLGSHSVLRTRTKAKKHTVAENRQRMLQVRAEGNRDHLFRFEHTDGKAGPVQSATLRPFVEGDAILGRFADIPGKENGVDMEGLAVRGEELYVGFRSPVLRGNLVPIAKTRFGTPEVATLLFVDLDGHGVRDLAAVDDGFLILSGPSADGPGEYRVHFWNGADGVPGSDADGSVTCELGTFEAPSGGKAEGLAVVTAEGDCYDALIVFDSVRGGAPARARLCIPDGCDAR